MHLSAIFFERSEGFLVRLEQGESAGCIRCLMYKKLTYGSCPSL